MIFLKQSIDSRQPGLIKQRHPEAEEVVVHASEKIILHGWLVHSRKTPAPLLIYFGGNAEEVSYLTELKNIFSGWSILLVNYRGYGLSTGRPGEKAILTDALLLYDVFSAGEGIDKTKISVMGRSIGCAPAVYLSAHRRIAGTVLISPFGSMEDIAAAAYPWLPVRLLLKHKFNMIPYAQAAENRMLAVAASNDTIIPVHHSEKLFDSWKGEKKLQLIEYADHNDLSLSPGFWENINVFLESISF